jgi:hypothetical protein
MKTPASSKEQLFIDLYRTFGAITPQSLAAAKATLEATIFNHTKPLANIFTAITRYADMASAAECEETTPQLINIGSIIITRPTVFANDISNWHELPLDDKTWNRFKTHFKDAQRNIIRSLPAVTTDSLRYHEQANAASVPTVADQVIGQLQAQHDADSALTSSLLLLKPKQAASTKAVDTPAPCSKNFDQLSSIAKPHTSKGVATDIGVLFCHPQAYS